MNYSQQQSTFSFEKQNKTCPKLNGTASELQSIDQFGQRFVMKLDGSKTE